MSTTSTMSTIELTCQGLTVDIVYVNCRVDGTRHDEGQLMSPKSYSQNRKLKQNRTELMSTVPGISASELRYLCSLYGIAAQNIASVTNCASYDDRVYKVRLHSPLRFAQTATATGTASAVIVKCSIVNTLACKPK